MLYIWVFFGLTGSITCIDKNWWKYNEIYEVFVPSFKDSNGDGIGDLAGE